MPGLTPSIRVVTVGVLVCQCVTALNHGEGRPIGLITFVVTCAGTPSAKNPPARCNAAGVGNGAAETSESPRRFPTLPSLNSSPRHGSYGCRSHLSRLA
jgi:hypothetical protein